MARKTLLFFSSIIFSASGFYLPGVTPVEYPIGSPLRIKVNSITSTKTAIPYDFYDLPFCRPGGAVPKPQVENFGEILWGDSIKPSPYVVHMGVNLTCRRACTVSPSSKEMKRLRDRIEEGYRGHLMLDNLPVSEIFTQKVKGFRTFMLGYPLGTPKQPKNSIHPSGPEDASQQPFVSHCEIPQASRLCSRRERIPNCWIPCGCLKLEAQ